VCVRVCLCVRVCVCVCVCVGVRVCAYILFLYVGDWVKVWAFIHRPRHATYVYRGIKARSRKHCYRGKAISITYSECVFVSLRMQCAWAILPSVACPAVPYFSTLSHKRKGFRKKKLLGIKCVCLIFCTTFVRNISHSKNNPARYYHKCTQVCM
jgi:hypothetical protein